MADKAVRLEPHPILERATRSSARDSGEGEQDPRQFFPITTDDNSPSFLKNSKECALVVCYLRGIRGFAPQNEGQIYLSLYTMRHIYIILSPGKSLFSENLKKCTINSTMSIKELNCAYTPCDRLSNEQLFSAQFGKKPDMNIRAPGICDPVYFLFRRFRLHNDKAPPAEETTDRATAIVQRALWMQVACTRMENNNPLL
jgi:hypothetical protein